jgi:hypothetical protein
MERPVLGDGISAIDYGALLEGTIEHCRRRIDDLLRAEAR